MALAPVYRALLGGLAAMEAGFAAHAWSLDERVAAGYFAAAALAALLLLWATRAREAAPQGQI